MSLATGTPITVAADAPAPGMLRLLSSLAFDAGGMRGALVRREQQLTKALLTSILPTSSSSPPQLRKPLTSSSSFGFLGLLLGGRVNGNNRNDTQTKADTAVDATTPQHHRRATLGDVASSSSFSPRNIDASSAVTNKHAAPSPADKSQSNPPSPSTPLKSTRTHAAAKVAPAVPAADTTVPAAALPHRPSAPITNPVEPAGAATAVSAAPAAAAPRLPLSAVVSALVDEWSRSYTVEALKGDVESMCMLASGHFSKNGWGCIPHDVQRGHDWLARAKQAVVQQAKEEAKAHGRPLCSRASSAVKEKAAALEQDVIHANVFAPDVSCCATAAEDHHPAEPDAADDHPRAFSLQDTSVPLDDQLSSGSLASLDVAGAFSCDLEGGGGTDMSLINGVQLPGDESTADGCGAAGGGSCTGRESVSLESDGHANAWPCSNANHNHSPHSAHHHCPPSNSLFFTSSPASRTSSVRNSISHPDLRAAWGSGGSNAAGLRAGSSTNSPVPASGGSVAAHVEPLYECDSADDAEEDEQHGQQKQGLESATPPRHSSAPMSPAAGAVRPAPSVGPLSELDDDMLLLSTSSSSCLSTTSAGSSVPHSRAHSQVNSPATQSRRVALLQQKQQLTTQQQPQQQPQQQQHQSPSQHHLQLHASAEQAAQDAAKDEAQRACLQQPPLRRANSANN